MPRTLHSPKLWVRRYLRVMPALLPPTDTAQKSSCTKVIIRTAPELARASSRKHVQHAPRLWLFQRHSSAASAGAALQAGCNVRVGILRAGATPQQALQLADEFFREVHVTLLDGLVSCHHLRGRLDLFHIHQS